MRILLVEDDDMLGAATRDGLTQDGLATHWVRSASECAALSRSAYDVTLLDLGLPDGSGTELLKAWRRDGDTQPVIVITARGQVADRVALLNLGADDYVCKPFDFDELAARIQAVCRRPTREPAQGLAQGRLSLHPHEHNICLDGSPLDLTRSEYALLSTLLRQPQRIHSREQLQAALGPAGERIDSNSVEVHIHHLRRKVSPDVVRTVRGLGYMLGDVASD